MISYLLITQHIDSFQNKTICPLLVGPIHSCSLFVAYRLYIVYRQVFYVSQSNGFTFGVQGSGADRDGKVAEDVGAVGLDGVASTRSNLFIAQSIDS